MGLRKKIFSTFTIMLAVFAGIYVVGEVCNSQVFAKADYSGIIRFHVKANSNSEEDQALKLKVRDGVLEAVNEMILTETIASYTIEDYECAASVQAAKTGTGSNICAVSKFQESMEGELASRSAVEASAAIEQVTAQLSMDETRELLTENLDKIEAIAEEIIKESGYDYEAKAALGIARIPRKTYGDVTFPAGNYEALTIEIGEANGENWWCVLFPPLCIIDPSGESLAGIETSSANTSASADMVGSSVLQGDQASQVIKLKFKTQEIMERFGVI